jgi:hypothetical protein
MDPDRHVVPLPQNKPTPHASESWPASEAISSNDDPIEIADKRAKALYAVCRVKERTPEQWDIFNTALLDVLRRPSESEWRTMIDPMTGLPRRKFAIEIADVVEAYEAAKRLDMSIDVVGAIAAQDATRDRRWLPVWTRLKQALGEGLAVSWFDAASLVDIAGDAATVSLPTRFLCDYVRTHFDDAILRAVKAEHPQVERVSFVVDAVAHG